MSDPPLAGPALDRAVSASVFRHQVSETSVRSCVSPVDATSPIPAHLVEGRGDRTSWTILTSATRCRRCGETVVEVRPVPKWSTDPARVCELMAFVCCGLDAQLIIAPSASPALIGFHARFVSLAREATLGEARSATLPAAIAAAAIDAADASETGLGRRRQESI